MPAQAGFFICEEEMSNALSVLTSKLAATLDMGGQNGTELIQTLKATAFKGQVTDAQMTALMVVANQYGLNPWTREIYAFSDKGAIVPVVGVDGWARIINNHPQLDGIEFEQDDESCTAIIYRKDRSRPVRVTEYMGECKKGTPAWHSHPRRMLRHKALIQCARLAFGFGGIHDPEDAPQIAREREAVDMTTGEILKPVPQQQKQLPAHDDALFAKKLPTWEKNVKDGSNPATLEAMLSSKYTLTEKQLQSIRNLGAQDVQPKVAAEPVPPQENQEKDAPPPPDDDFIRAYGDV
jgi:phage recombination protein Bet